MKETYELKSGSAKNFKEGSIYVCPVGLDKIKFECVLKKEEKDKFFQQSKEESKWIKRTNKRKEIYYYFTDLIISNNGNKKKGKLNWGLKESTRGYPEGVRQCWVLSLYCNPSHWMNDAEVRGAVDGLNYVAGNSRAIVLMLKAINGCLGSSPFAFLSNSQQNSVGENFDQNSHFTIDEFQVTQIEITGDYHLRPLPETDIFPCPTSELWEEAHALQIVQLFHGSGPPRTKFHEIKNIQVIDDNQSYLKYLRGKAEKLKRSTSTGKLEDIQEKIAIMEGEETDSYNQHGVPPRYLNCKFNHRQSVFYVKARRHTGKLEGAALRFELRLIGSAEIRKTLRDDESNEPFRITELLKLVEQSDHWNDSGEGQTPLLETLVDTRLRAWMGFNGEARRKVETIEKRIEAMVEEEERLQREIEASRNIQERQKKSKALEKKLKIWRDTDKVGMKIRVGDTFKSFLLRLHDECSEFQAKIWKFNGEPNDYGEGVENHCETGKLLRRIIEDDVTPGCLLDFETMDYATSLLQMNLIELGARRFFEIAREVAHLTEKELLTEKDKIRQKQKGDKAYLRLKGTVEYLLYYYDRDAWYQRERALKCLLRCPEV